MIVSYFDYTKDTGKKAIMFLMKRRRSSHKFIKFLILKNSIWNFARKKNASGLAKKLYQARAVMANEILIRIKGDIASGEGSWIGG